MIFSNTHTSDEPGFEIASLIGFLVWMMSAKVIAAKRVSAPT
jgi:hypothetical protein